MANRFSCLDCGAALRDGPGGPQSTCPDCRRAPATAKPRLAKPVRAGKPPIIAKRASEPIPLVVAAPRLAKPVSKKTVDLKPTGSPDGAATTSKGRKWPINVAVIIASVTATGTLSTVLATPLRWFGLAELGYATVLLSVLPASLFGGALATALAPHSPNKHCLYAAIWDGIVSSLFFGLAVALVAFQPASADTESLSSFAERIAPFSLGLALLPFGYLLGGWIERAVTAIARKLRPRQVWTHETFEKLRFRVLGPWRFPFLAFLWRTTGWLLILTCWIHIPWGAKGNNSGAQLISAFVLGRLCFGMAKKRTGTSAKEALEADDRPPVVYLRSFQDDGVMVTGFWDSINDAIGLLRRRTYESHLIDSLKRYGPVVAIGRPGEELPELGAARVYVDDDHWQMLIADLLKEEGAVAVLRAGETEGLAWEMQKVGEFLPPERVLLFLPFALKGTKRSRDRRYAAFRAWANASFPAELPEAIGEVSVFYFDSEPAWDTNILETDSVLPSGHPLKRSLSSMRDNKAFWPKRFFNWKRDRWALFFFALFFSAIFVAFLWLTYRIG